MCSPPSAEDSAGEKTIMNDEQDIEATASADRAVQRRGAEHAVDRKPRKGRVILRGVSARRYAALLDEQEKHRRAAIEAVLGDALGTSEAIEHAWSVLEKRIRAMFDVALSSDADAD
jgi:hypothetical protein